MLDLHFVDNDPATPVSAAKLNQLVAGVNEAAAMSDALLATRLREQSSETWSALRNGPINVATESALAAQAVAVNSVAVSLHSSTATLDGTTDDTAAIQAFLDGLPAGKVVTMPAGKTAKLNAAVVLSKPTTVSGWKLSLGPANKAIAVTSSDVTVRECDIAGYGISAMYVNGARAITASGTSAAPLRNVNILRNNITGINDTCIHTSWTKDSLIEDNYCQNFVYAGILVSSGTDVDVIGNTTRDATQGSTGNSYGIAITDLDNTIAARSTRVKVHFNTVSGVPEWEGIDTHGGAYVSIIGNIITGCRRAIQALVGNEPTRVTCPQHAVIMGNTIDGSGVPYATTGITLYGKADLSMLASGVVVGNYITNCTTPTLVNYTDPAKTIVRLNTGADTESDTGWLPLTGFYAGWSSNSTYPARYRVVKTGKLTTVYLEGVLSRTTGTTNLLTLPAAANPGYPKPLGVTSTSTAVGPQLGTLEINDTGILRLIYTEATTNNITLTATYVF